MGVFQHWDTHPQYFARSTLKYKSGDAGTRHRDAPDLARAEGPRREDQAAGAGHRRQHVQAGAQLGGDPALPADPRPPGGPGEGEHLGPGGESNISYSYSYSYCYCCYYYYYYYYYLYC